ncbi:MAG: hypothetical protein ACR2PG_00290 [Hyphomicrobiaceae bacterium]
MRSALITIAAFCFFSAIATIPLADTVAVFFINPFVIRLVVTGGCKFQISIGLPVSNYRR